MMRHLLMFSYYFPPHGGGGVLRPLQTARLLAENGWRTTVVAGPESGWWLRDESLLEGLPKEVEIVRTRALSGPGLLRLFSRNRPRQPGRGTTGRSERAIRLFRYLADWSGVPDVYCGWIPFAARAGKKIASSVDCVLSTSPVESAHLAARLVAQACNKPWIADFRDPWVRGIYRRYPTALHRRFQERLEQMVVRDAGAVIVNTGAALEDFHYRYPDLPPEKFVAIPNGYDPQEFKKQKAERVVEPGPLKMIHAGGLSLDRDPCTVFKALAELKKESTGENAPLPPQLELVGLVDEKFRSRAETLGVDDLVTFTGPVSRSVVLEKLAEADVGLVLESFRPGAELVVPGKMYEYLGAGLTVLAVVPEGAAALLVSETGCGVTVTGPGSGPVTKALREMARRHAAGENLAIEQRNTAEIEKYRREKQVARLSALLTGVRDY